MPMTSALSLADRLKGDVDKPNDINIVVGSSLFDLLSVKEQAMLRLTLLRAALRELDRWQMLAMRYVRLGEDLLERAARARAWEEEFLEYVSKLPDLQPHERKPAQPRTGPAAKSDPGRGETDSG